MIPIVKEQKSAETMELLKEKHRHERRIAEIRHKHVRKQAKVAEKERKRILSTLLQERNRGHVFVVGTVIIITVAIILLTAKSKNRLIQFKNEKAEDTITRPNGLCSFDLLP